MTGRPLPVEAVSERGQEDATGAGQGQVEGGLAAAAAVGLATRACETGEWHEETSAIWPGMVCRESQYRELLASGQDSDDHRFVCGYINVHALTAAADEAGWAFNVAEERMTWLTKPRRPGPSCAPRAAPPRIACTSHLRFCCVSGHDGESISAPE